MLLFSLISICLCEIFKFEKPGSSIQLRFRLEANNINTGFFKAEPGSNLTYSAEIVSKDGKKILYKLEKPEEGVEAHFSFNNDVSQEVIMKIESSVIKEGEPYSTGYCHMKFESVADTFNKDISKKFQIEPAIYTLEQLLKRVNELTSLTQTVSERVKKLGKSSTSTTWFTVLYNILTPVFYLLLSVVEIRALKKRIQQKKL